MKYNFKSKYAFFVPQLLLLLVLVCSAHAGCDVCRQRFEERKTLDRLYYGDVDAETLQRLKALQGLWVLADTKDFSYAQVLIQGNSVSIIYQIDKGSDQVLEKTMLVDRADSTQLMSTEPPKKLSYDILDKDIPQTLVLLMNRPNGDTAPLIQLVRNFHRIEGRVDAASAEGAKRVARIS